MSNETQDKKGMTKEFGLSSLSLRNSTSVLILTFLIICGAKNAPGNGRTYSINPHCTNPMIGLNECTKYMDTAPDVWHSTHTLGNIRNGTGR